MSIGERIKKLRSENGYTQTEFASSLNLSQSVLSLIEADRSSLTIDTIRKISELLHVNAHWLIYGEPSFLKNLDPATFIPLVQGKHLNTYLHDRGKSSEEQQWPFFSIPGFGGRELKIFETRGQAMEPGLNAGDLMICQKEKFCEPYCDGRIYLCVTVGEMLLRRVYFPTGNGGPLLLCSDNPDFDDIWIDIGEIEESWRVVSRISGVGNGSVSKTARYQNIEKEILKLRDKLEMMNSHMAKPKNP